MTGTTLEAFSGIILVSKDPPRLARFYREVLEIPLVDEQHDETLPHYGCTLGEVHFAIHPVQDFPDEKDGVGAVKLAFTVFDVEALVKKLAEKGVAPLYPPRDTGFFITTAIQDPDGNFLEFTELCDDWFEHLKKRRSEDSDLLKRWESLKSKKT